LSVLNSPVAPRDSVTEKGEGGQKRERENKGSEKKKKRY
jgi:hypothetical protein